MTWRREKGESEGVLYTEWGNSKHEAKSKIGDVGVLFSHMFYQVRAPAKQMVKRGSPLAKSWGKEPHGGM